MIASAAAISGISAQYTRVGVAAMNITNQQSRGSLDKPGPAGQLGAYQGSVVDTVAQTGGGTTAVVRKMVPPIVSAYDPQSIYANADGQVAIPNVDSSRDIMTMMNAATTYRSNLAVLKTVDQMEREVMHLTA